MKRHVIAIKPNLHSRLRIKATSEGRFLQTIVEEKLWELFPEEKTAGARKDEPELAEAAV